MGEQFWETCSLSSGGGGGGLFDTAGRRRLQYTRRPAPIVIVENISTYADVAATKKRFLVSERGYKICIEYTIFILLFTNYLEQ